MKTLVVLFVLFAVLFALTVGAARVEAGGLFDAGSGERIAEAAIAGVVVGVAVGVLGEVLGGDRHRDVVFVPGGRGHGGYGGYDGGWDRGGRGCRGCSYEYMRGYGSGRAAGEKERLYDRFSRGEERRRVDAIRSDRARDRGWLDGFRDGRRRH